MTTDTNVDDHDKQIRYHAMLGLKPFLNQTRYHALACVPNHKRYHAMLGFKPFLNQTRYHALACVPDHMEPEYYNLEPDYAAMILIMHL